MIEALQPCFTGNLTWFGDRIALSGEREPTLAAAELLEPPTARRVIGGFAAAYSDCDRRAVVSLWAQWYFAALVIPCVVAAVRLGRQLPVGIDEVGIALGDDALPDAVVLHHAGNIAPHSTASVFPMLVGGHVEPLIDSLCTVFAVAPRLLWSNAATVLEWTLTQTEAGPIADEACLAEGRRLVSERTLANGFASPLYQPVRYVLEGGVRVRRRKVCCLRYLLRGEEHCGSLCPLPAIRRNA
ncbi:siderophore-iron reductase FhuF [Pseudochelatococcus sp. B33]